MSDDARTAETRPTRTPWSKGKLTGPKSPLKVREIWASRIRLHLTTPQYARLVNRWVAMVGLDPADYGTHSLRRTKATLIYRWTKNLRAVQLLLGHRKLESTVRYLGVEVEDALEISEQTEV